MSPGLEGPASLLVLDSFFKYTSCSIKTVASTQDCTSDRPTHRGQTFAAVKWGFVRESRFLMLWRLTMQAGIKCHCASLGGLARRPSIAPDVLCHTDDEVSLPIAGLAGQLSFHSSTGNTKRLFDVNHIYGNDNNRSTSNTNPNTML